VVWTERSITSKWVKREARYADSAGKLIPILLEKCLIPWEFSDSETADLTDWKGEPDHKEFKLLIESVTEALGEAAAGKSPVLESTVINATAESILGRPTEGLEPESVPASPKPPPPAVSANQAESPTISDQPTKTRKKEPAHVDRPSATRKGAKKAQNDSPSTPGSLPVQPTEKKGQEAQKVPGMAPVAKTDLEKKEQRKKAPVVEKKAEDSLSARSKPIEEPKIPINTQVAKPITSQGKPATGAASNGNTIWGTISVLFWIVVFGFGVRACTSGKLSEMGSQIYGAVFGKPTPSPRLAPFPSPTLNIDPNRQILGGRSGIDVLGKTPTPTPSLSPSPTIDLGRFGIGTPRPRMPTPPPLGSPRSD
jgi:hypothetical protein